MAIDPNIKQKAEDIRKKIFGSEVRESLASGLEGMSEDVESIKGRQDTVETTFQEVIDETTDKDVISAPELIAARNGELNLKTRLDKEKQEVTAQLQQTEQELSSQLAQATRKRKLEDLDSEVLSAIEGGEGTSFSLLSVPQQYSVTWDKTTFIVTGKNKYNPLRDTNGTLGSSGQVVASDTNSIVDYILIKEGDSVYISYGSLQNQFNNRIVVYDKQKNVLEVLSDYVSGTPITTSGANYVRTAVRNDILSQQFMISLNGLPPYEDYIEYFNNVKISKDDVIGLNEAIETSGSHLEGQKMVFFGDSITGNALVDDYPSIVSKRTGMTVYNVGFGGTHAGYHGDPDYNRYSFYKLVDYILSGDFSQLDLPIAGGKPTPYATREPIIKSIDFNQIDYISIAYGANDWGANSPDEKEDEHDPTSFRGALRSGISRLLVAYPHLKVVIISPFYRWFPNNDPIDDSDTVLRLNYTMPQYHDAAEAIAKEFKAVFIDTYYSLNINKYNRLEYFSPTDGTHHQAKGRLAIGNKVASRMLSEF